MGTLQDIGQKLMRPVKELVAWDFPLAQILEEYFALLGQPCHVNFGEAALVLQNSVDAYGKRIDELSDEAAAALSQSCLNNDQQETPKTKKYERRTKTNSLDFNHFELLDLSKEIGKNIDLKNKPGTQKTVKLTSKRFTQLENDDLKNAHPIVILDVKGEVIGRKCDFRCNQYVSIDGILVDDLTPRDFKNWSLEDASSPLSRAEIGPDRARSSGYCSNSSYHETSSIYSETAEHINYEIEKEAPQTFEKTPLNKSIDAGIFNCTQSLMDRDETSIGNVTPKSAHNESRVSNSSHGEVQMDSGYMSALDASLTESTRSENVNTAMSTKRRKRNIWEPILLTEGTKDMALDKKNAFRLPMRIDLSNDFELSKRKCIRNDKMDDCMSKFLSKVSTVDENGPVNHALQKAARDTLKPGDLEEFQKSFHDILYSPGHTNLHYNAVKTITMNILGDPMSNGFHNALNSCVRNDVDKENDMIQLSPDRDSSSRSPTPCEDNMRSQDLRDFVDESELKASSSDCLLPADTYEKRINDKMKEIFDDDDRTEIEKTVAKWHHLLQPRLAEAEARNAFMIKDYAAKIIDVLRKTEDKELEFEKVVEGQHSAEVARYFLATLQLANTYNVDLNRGVTSSGGVKLHLLNEGNNTSSDM